MFFFLMSPRVLWNDIRAKTFTVNTFCTVFLKNISGSQIFKISGVFKDSIFTLFPSLNYWGTLFQDLSFILHKSVIHRSELFISPERRHLAEPMSPKNGNALGICMHDLLLICLSLQASQHREQLCSKQQRWRKLLYLWQCSSFFCCQKSDQM